MTKEFCISRLIMNWRASHAVAAHFGIDKNSKHLLHYIKDFRVDLDGEDDNSDDENSDDETDFATVDDMIRNGRFAK